MWTLVVMGHGRWEYLTRTLISIDETVGLGWFDRRVLSVDGPGFDQGLEGFECLFTGTRAGLTANLAQAWGALGDDDEWVFFCEEDFLIREAPLNEMADTLDAYPHVANMVLARQPWNQDERRAGSVLATICGLEDRDGWLEHTAGFWLNPHVAHVETLQNLTAGVESDLTGQCRERDWTFGYWGARDDPPRCLHIGAEGGMGSPGWRA